MTLHAQLDAAVAEDTVEFLFTVENGGTEPVELSFRSGQTTEVVVLEGDVEVWRWSEGRLFTQALQTETLSPGGTRTYEMRWDDPMPGEYEARATLAARAVDAEARVRFVV